MLQTKTFTAQLIYVISCIIHSSNSYRSIANYRKSYSSYKYSSLQSTANTKYNAFEDEINLELLEKISKKPPKSFLTQFDESQLISSMMAAGKAVPSYVLFNVKMVFKLYWSRCCQSRRILGVYITEDKAKETSCGIGRRHIKAYQRR